MPNRCPVRAASSGPAAAALVLVLAAAGPSFAGDPQPPVPAPGQEVPRHAAGGWPTATSSDDRPARTPEQQARLDEVTNELHRIAEAHGPDAVVLQSKLLVRAMGAGAIGATEVAVVGATGGPGEARLEIDVDTGVWFDETATTEESRRDRLWTEVALPVLDEMTGFRIDPPSLELVLLCDVQDPRLQAAGVLDPSGEGRREAFRVRIDRAVLDDIASNTISGEALRPRVDIATIPAPPRRAATTLAGHEPVPGAAQ